MIFSQTDIVMDEALDRAVADAMRHAARVAILPRYFPGQAIASDFKAVGEEVTAADRESEAILAELLMPLIPGAHVVGEEAAHHDPGLLDRLGQGTCWTIDPLDGTGNFAAGQQPFGMLVALADQGRPVAGWILDPVTDRFCAAQAGFGATIDGARFRVPEAMPLRPLVAVTRLFANQVFRSDVMAALGGAFEMVDSPRCAADQYPRVALGGNHATLFTRTIAWDHAAGVVFLNEAGGLALRQDGSAYRCDEPDAGLVIATDARHWQSVVHALDESGLKLAGAHIAAH